MICEKMRCENAATGLHNILGLSCYSNQARFMLEIEYSEVEKDTLFLCGHCAETIQADAKKHGYKTEITKMM